jgi:hypothetical protein
MNVTVNDLFFLFMSFGLVLGFYQQALRHNSSMDKHCYSIEGADLKYNGDEASK